MAGPHINSLDPNTVKKDTAVTVRVKGSNFNDASFVFVDGASPACKYVSSTEVTVELSKQHTSTAGKKSVKVHNANDGTLSNEVSLSVV